MLLVSYLVHSHTKLIPNERFESYRPLNIVDVSELNKVTLLEEGVIGIL